MHVSCRTPLRVEGETVRFAGEAVGDESSKGGCAPWRRPPKASSLASPEFKPAETPEKKTARTRPPAAHTALAAGFQTTIQSLRGCETRFLGHPPALVFSPGQGYSAPKSVRAVRSAFNRNQLIKNGTQSTLEARLRGIQLVFHTNSDVISVLVIRNCLSVI